MGKLETTARQQWFMDRIGKRVYLSSPCSCGICKSMGIKGVLIHSEADAKYFFGEESESESAFKFFDTPQEVLEFKEEKNYLT